MVADRGKEQPLVRCPRGELHCDVAVRADDLECDGRTRAAKRGEKRSHRIGSDHALARNVEDERANLVVCGEIARLRFRRLFENGEGGARVVRGWPLSQEASRLSAV